MSRIMMTTHQSKSAVFQCILFTGLILLAGQAGIVSAAETINLDSRLQIMENLAQYSYRWDGKDSDGFANLFTEDGVMERRVEGELVPGSRVEGKAAILDYARRSHQGRLADRQTRHHFSALIFLELTADQAVTENMALITHQTAGSGRPFISGSGIYRITWRKTQQGWKMTSRVLSSDSFSGQ